MRNFSTMDLHIFSSNNENMYFFTGHIEEGFIEITLITKYQHSQILVLQNASYEYFSLNVYNLDNHFRHVFPVKSGS